MGCLYALPNLYPTQPAIQIAYTDSAKSADQSLLDEAESILDNETSGYEEIFLRDNKIVIKFNTLDQQLESKTALQNMMNSLEKGDEVIAASGILGKVKEIKGAYISLEVGENLVLKFQKSAVSSVLPKGTVDSIK